MAIDIMTTQETTTHKTHPTTEFSLWAGIKRILEPVASLKLTVALFALSIGLILAGTFAQVDKDIWEVIGTYFRVWFAWVPFQVFFPPSFSPEKPVVVGGGIWYPGGKLLGLLLAINLVAAHLIRFKAVAKGTRLYAGLAAIALGCIATWGIIAAGGNSKGMQAGPWLPYSTQWIGYQGLVAFAALCAAFGFLSRFQRSFSQFGAYWAREALYRSVLAILSVGLLSLLFWMFIGGQAGRPTDSSLRILWQLAQGSVASMALLVGCCVVFGKRAGIVLLHGGVGLMMFYELHVAMTAIETQMNLAEGERTNYVHDIRTFELAVIDTSDSQEDRIVAIPKSIMLRADYDHQPIDAPELPFKIEISGFLKNAILRDATKSDTNPATAGVGLHLFPVKTTASAGTDTDSKVDYPVAYATLSNKSDGTLIGTHLIGFLAAPDSVRVGDKTYQIELRPKRYYKPYSFELKDVRKENYLGTDIAKHYASTVQIVDPTRSVDEEKTIWMNNPLRFAGETFYQSGYSQDENTGHEHATLSVVANSGWMMPYVGCMLVGIGMLFHFLILLVRFLTRSYMSNLSAEQIGRRALFATLLGSKFSVLFVIARYLLDLDDETAATEQSGRAAELAAKLGIKPAVSTAASSDAPPKSWISRRLPSVFAVAITACVIAYFGMVAAPPKPTLTTFDLYRFGRIPVVSEGRAKPIDSAATSDLLAISGLKALTIEDEHGKLSLSQRVRKMFGADVKPTIQVSAVQWLLEVITEAKIVNKREIFRVENLGLQETIGVKKREGMRYSVEELLPNFKEILRQIDLADDARRNDPKSLSVFQKKVLEFAAKLNTFKNLRDAFGLQYKIDDKHLVESFTAAFAQTEHLEAKGQPLLAIGPTDDDDKWHVYSRAWMMDLVKQGQKKGTGNPTVLAWEKILNAYSEDKPAAFNQGVDELLKLVDEKPPVKVTPWIIDLESYINHSQPFTHACRMYLVAFIAGAIGWLFWPRGFNRAAFGILIVTFVVHSLALWARLEISGRPPVTNLYSSAIFIGWGCVLLGLLFEVVYGIGIGNLVAAVAGCATLQIADQLTFDGDTFTVLQAVLDTQFWLATHVTCITLGYATTYLAGLFGIAYILRGVLTPSMTAEDGRDINRMIYGTLCFSIFFSFVGTVLGGLWADDSWGRFWGWDPKENAALIIVLWNALALHARWGGMVKERGLAALAVGGNIFVSWSWWGVNALGTGLHSYGFKQGTLLNLGLFILLNLFIISIGMLPKNCWWSLRRRAAA